MWLRFPATWSYLSGDQPWNNQHLHVMENDFCIQVQEPSTEQSLQASLVPSLANVLQNKEWNVEQGHVGISFSPKQGCFPQSLRSHQHQAVTPPSSNNFIS